MLRQRPGQDRRPTECHIKYPDKVYQSPAKSLSEVLRLDLTIALYRLPVKSLQLLVTLFLPNVLPNYFFSGSNYYHNNHSVYVFVFLYLKERKSENNRRVVPHPTSRGSTLARDMIEPHRTRLCTVHPLNSLLCQNTTSRENNCSPFLYVST